MFEQRTTIHGPSSRRATRRGVCETSGQTCNPALAIREKIGDVAPGHLVSVKKRGNDSSSPGA